MHLRLCCVTRGGIAEIAMIVKQKFVAEILVFFEFVLTSDDVKSNVIFNAF